ncbi:hypothetical protein SAVIM338S_02885 [Streptomyces avidinii]
MPVGRSTRRWWTSYDKPSFDFGAQRGEACQQARRPGNGGSPADQRLKRGLLWAALSCTNAPLTTPQRDPPQQDGRTGLGEWRPADRERARVTTRPYTPAGGHAIGSKEPPGRHWAATTSGDRDRLRIERNRVKPNPTDIDRQQRSCRASLKTLGGRSTGPVRRPCPSRHRVTAVRGISGLHRSALLVRLALPSAVLAALRPVASPARHERAGWRGAAKFWASPPGRCLSPRTEAPRFPSLIRRDPHAFVHR